MHLLFLHHPLAHHIIEGIVEGVLRVSNRVGEYVKTVEFLRTDTGIWYKEASYSLIDKSDKSRTWRVRRTLGGTPFQTGV